MSAHDRQSRRQFLRSTSGALVAWSFMPRIAWAAPSRDPRLLVVVLRGGMDGLAAVAPVGDPNYERVREGLIVPAQGAGAAMKLNDYFVLNPHMPTLGRLYAKNEAIVLHAAATACHPYRTDGWRAS